MSSSTSNINFQTSYNYLMMEAEERPLKKRRVSQSPEPIAETVRADYVDLRNNNEHPRYSNEQRSEFYHATEPGNEDEKSLSTPDTPRDGGVGILENAEENGAALNKPDDVATSEPQLSKNQLKKLKRQQEWEASRSARRAKRKAKIKEKKERKRAAPDNTEGPRSPPINGHLEGGSPAQETPRHSPRRSIQLPITFVLDCGFDDSMLDKERVSLAAQLTRCYSDNHHAPFKAHMALSSFGGHLKERFDTVLSGHHRNWKGVRFLSEDFVEAAEQAKDWMAGEDGGVLAGAFTSTSDSPTTIEPNSNHKAAGEIIYLTSDSPQTLTALKPYSTYIIGGLVDRNRHKGICYKRALDHGMRTAKLPIGEYMEMTSRFVLATNHVAEIMLRWLEVGDWGQAFLKVVPKRKGGVLKGVKGAKRGVEEDGDDSVKDHKTIAEA